MQQQNIIMLHVVFNDNAIPECVYLLIAALYTADSFAFVVLTPRCAVYLI